jgi:hypothetical protein
MHGRWKSDIEVPMAEQLALGGDKEHVTYGRRRAKLADFVLFLLQNVFGVCFDQSLSI